MQSKKNFLVWSITIALGWTIGSLLMAVNKNGVLLADTFSLLFSSLLQGTLIGAIIGVGQSFIFNIQNRSRWIGRVMVIFALLKPLGILSGLLIFNVSSVLWGYGLSFPAGSNVFWASPSNIDAVFGGWVIGLGLWLSLDQSVLGMGTERKKIKWLCILGGWASMGIGVFFGLAAGGMLENLIVGGILGVGTGIILWIVTKEKPGLLNSFGLVY